MYQLKNELSKWFNWEGEERETSKEEKVDEGNLGNREKNDPGDVSLLLCASAW